jgi:hypothetical protein
VVVDEFIWEGAATSPSRKVFQCQFCRDQARGQEQRNLAVEKADTELYEDLSRQERVRTLLRSRFAAPTSDQPLPDELLDLYTPRTLVALDALIARLDTDLRAAPINAALRLALAGTLLNVSKLHSYPGRVATCASSRVTSSRLVSANGASATRGWRSTSSAGRYARSSRVSPPPPAPSSRATATTSTPHRRHGQRRAALGQPGSAWQRARLLATAAAVSRPARSALAYPARVDAAARALDEPKNLSFAYLATCLVLGRDKPPNAARRRLWPAPSAAPGAARRTALRKALLAVRPVWQRDASAVVVLDRTGPSGLVAGVLGGVGAVFRWRRRFSPKSGRRSKECSSSPSPNRALTR